MRRPPLNYFRGLHHAVSLPLPQSSHCQARIPTPPARKKVHVVPALSNSRVTKFNRSSRRQLLTSMLVVNLITDTNNITVGEQYPAYTIGNPLSLRDAIAIANNTTAANPSAGEFDIRFDPSLTSAGPASINLSQVANMARSGKSCFWFPAKSWLRGRPVRPAASPSIRPAVALRVSSW